MGGQSRPLLEHDQARPHQGGHRVLAERRRLARHPAVLGLIPTDRWFTSIETPELRVVERTHVVDVGDDTTIELFDATDAVADLVEWSLGRYEAAGLGPPHVDAVCLETERSCLQESAWTHLNTESFRSLTRAEPLHGR